MSCRTLQAATWLIAALWAAATDASQPIVDEKVSPPAPVTPANPLPPESGLQSLAPVTQGYATRGAGPAAGNGPYWAPGGYEARIGSPYYYHAPYGNHAVITGNPYYDHFGPGFQRHSLHGHYRFPYYNYRAPWYYPGSAVYNRDTNLPW